MSTTKKTKQKWGVFRKGQTVPYHVCDTFDEAMEYLSTAQGKWHAFWTLEEVHKGSCHVAVYTEETKSDAG